MKFHRRVPPYIQQFAEEILASCRFVPPREERFFALIGANHSDERLDDFYQRLADSDPQQVKKLIFLLVGLHLDFALDRMDEDIKAQEKLIPTVCDAAQNFIEMGSEYLSYFPISAQKSFISEDFHIDLPMNYLEEMETLRKAVIAAQECLLRFQAHSPYIDPLTEYVLDSRKKTPRTRQIRQLVQLFFEEKIELHTRSVPTVLSLGLQIMGDEDLELSQVATIFREFSKLFAQKNVAE